MQRVRRVEHQRAGIELVRVRTLRVFDDELAAFVVSRWREEQREREIRTYARFFTHEGVVDVVAIAHAGGVAAEKDRPQGLWHRRQREHLVGGQGRDDELLQFVVMLRGGGELLVVLDQRRGPTRGLA